MKLSLYAKRAATAKTLLVRNPRMFVETSRLALRALRPAPKNPVSRTINGVRFEFDFELGPEVKHMFYGYYEYPTVRAMRALLKRGDTFIDVGANIGYISAVAMGLVGGAGSVYSFEPVPSYFDRLVRLADANPTFPITPEPVALGESSGTAFIEVSNDNIGWNSAIRGWMPAEVVAETVEVPIRRLDEYLQEAAISTPALIKVDTEGFDFLVLRGMSGFLERTSHRPPIISEVAPDGLAIIGTTVSEFWAYMAGWGYQAASLIDGSAVAAEDVAETMNVLFVAATRPSPLV
jgi:FkbM family methyltransferase